MYHTASSDAQVRHLPGSSVLRMQPEYEPRWADKRPNYFLRFVDRASPYNLVNKANLVHNFS